MFDSKRQRTALFVLASLCMLMLIVITISAVRLVGITQSNDSTQPIQWEYDFISTDIDEISPIGFDSPEVKRNAFFPGTIDQGWLRDIMAKMGREGWELVTGYTTIETVFPNFGKDEYVTGIRDNTRTRHLVLIFKRPLRNKAGNKNKESLAHNDFVVEEVEEVVGTAIDTAISY